jgi:hypothetical protein
MSGKRRVAAVASVFERGLVAADGNFEATGKLATCHTRYLYDEVRKPCRSRIAGASDGPAWR